MKVSLYNFAKFSLATFITLSILNAILWIGRLHIFIVYFKIIFVLFNLILYIIFLKKIIRTYNFWYIFTFLTIILFFAVSFYYKHNVGFMNSLLKNIMFIIYILYIYFTVNIIYLYHLSFNFKDKEYLVLMEIAKIFQKTILINFIFWMFIAILINKNLYDYTGERIGLSGFFDDRQMFGLLVAAWYESLLVLFYLTRKKIYFYSIVILLVFVILSDSRTSIAIVIISSFYLLFKRKIKYLEILILIFIFIYLSYIFSIGFENIEKLTSGRFLIWTLVLKEMFNNIFKGYGIFDLNNIILDKYYYSSYYFQKIDFLYFHNSFMEIFAAGGIVAFILFVLLIIRTYIMSSLITKAVVIGILTGSLFESYIVQPIFPISLLLWVLIFVENINFIYKRKN